MDLVAYRGWVTRPAGSDNKHAAASCHQIPCLRHGELFPLDVPSAARLSDVPRDTTADLPQPPAHELQVLVFRLAQPQMRFSSLNDPSQLPRACGTVMDFVTSAAGRLHPSP